MIVHLKNISPKESLHFDNYIKLGKFFRFSIGKFISPQLVKNFADAKIVHILEITC